MPTKSHQIGASIQNTNRGFYHRGDSFSHEHKTEIVTAYFELWEKDFPQKPSLSELARHVKASRKGVTNCIREFELTGSILDPKEKLILEKKKTKDQKIKDSVTGVLGTAEECFLLSLRAEDPSRPNDSYQLELLQEFGIWKSSKFISDWFRYRFEFPGVFRKSSFIPKDKFKQENVFRYLEFRMFLSVVDDHTRFNFIDEKHLVNSDCSEVKQRVDPLTGILEGIPVSGDFRDTRTIMACISVNPRKSEHIFYTCSSDTNNADSFMAFIESMIEYGFLNHGEVLILDNAQIHIGGSAGALEELLWSTIVNGEPLNCLVLYLPTRSPELNPIELVFHILVRRLKSFHYRRMGSLDEHVLTRIGRVFNDMDLALFEKCARHCGYAV